MVAIQMLIIASLLVSQVCSTPACSAEWCDPSHEPYPNIVSVMTGYHIIKGNPFSSGNTHDPGFETSYIFEPTEKDDQDRYKLVSGVTVRAVKRCTLSMSTDIISTVEEFKEKIGNKISEGTSFTSNLEAEVSGKVKGVGVKTNVPSVVNAAFSSSKEYKENSDFFTKKQGILTMNDATCSQYTVKIDGYHPPPFTSGFVNAVKQLVKVTNASSDIKQREFNKFIDNFGTHYVKTATMGARIAISRRYSRTEYENSKDSSINKCNTDRLEISLFASASHSKASCDAVAASASSSKVEGFSREYVTTYGSTAAKDLYDWSTQTFTAPLPIKMKLSPILNLFTSDMQRYGVDYKTVLGWIAPLYQNYCKNQKESLKTPSCHSINQNGCGWNDKCVPRLQYCINRQNTTTGYYCCNRKCLQSPCQNGGTCIDVEDSCGYRCNCTVPFMGATCKETYIDAGFLQKQVLTQMRFLQGQKEDRFRITLRDHLSSEYPRYWFTVFSYEMTHSYHALSARGSCVGNRKYGRTVVVCWARNNVAAPSPATQQRVLKGVTATIKSKSCSRTTQFASIAYKKAESYKIPITSVMILVHYGGYGGSPTIWSGQNTVQTTFHCSQTCKKKFLHSSCTYHIPRLVIMFGKP